MKNLKWVGIVILLIVVGVSVKNLIHCLVLRSNSPDLVFLENELHYWETKAKIVEEIGDFMFKKSPNHNVSSILVVNSSDKYSIDPRLFLSQGLLESNFGTKGIARKTNSVCNVGAWDDGTITHRYNHPNESIDPYFKLINEDYLVNKTEEDLLKKFVNKSGKRYATYVLYEKELQMVWDEINKTTKLDSLIEKYRHYRLELKR